MRFEVVLNDDDGPPCARAERKAVPRYDVRTYPTFEDFEAVHGVPFNAKGRAHEVLPDGKGIRRIGFYEEVWTADLSVLSLVGLAREHGELVVFPPPGPEAFPTVRLGDQT